ncbi:hypothetical protein [Thioclava sp. GXIMD2076]|uniref:Uncharacterized protein n=1 Tax=Thioclava kandeliae TaxID=3070818 RepID=A0ABV1SIQ0_9RHOB
MLVLLNTLVSSATELVSGLTGLFRHDGRSGHGMRAQDLQLQPVRVRADAPTKLQRQLRR